MSRRPQPDVATPTGAAPLDFVTGVTAGRSLVSRAGLFAVSGVAGRLVQLAAAPVYLHFLTPREYAIQAVAMLNEQVLLIIAGYAVTNAVGKYYWEGLRQDGDGGTVVGTALFAIGLGGLLFGVAWQLAAPVVARLTLDDSRSSVVVLRLVGVSFVGNMFFAFSMSVWLVAQKPRLYALGNFVLYAGSAVAAVSLLALAADPSPVHIAIGWAVAATVAAALGVHWIWRNHTLTVSRTLLVGLMRYGGPLVPAALLMLVLNSGDRYILRQVEGLSAVGVLSVAVLLATGVSHATVNPFKLAWASLVWRIRGQRNEADIHRQTLTWYVCAQALAVALLVVLARPLMILFSGGREEYVRAAMVVPLVYGGYALFGLYDIFAAGYFFEARTYYYTITVALATSINVAINLVLIPRIGVWGAGWADVASYGVFAALSYAFGRRFFRVQHDWKRASQAILIAGALGGLGVVLAESLNTVGYPLGVLLVLTFPLGLAAMGFFRESERAEVRHLCRRIRKKAAPS